MNSTEDFLNYYNKINSFIENPDGFESNITFKQKIKNSSNNIVQRYGDELLSYGELRNVIIRGQKVNKEAIVKPHQDTVVRIKELFEMITNPKKVIPEFQTEILGAKEDDLICDYLILMRRYSYSQLPVFNNKGNVIEVINTNTITRWLSSRIMKNEKTNIESVKVKELIPEIEFKNNYKFISKNKSLFDAFDYFTNQFKSNKKNLDTLFITKSGKSTEKLMGLITIENLATLA